MSSYLEVSPFLDYSELDLNNKFSQILLILKRNKLLLCICMHIHKYMFVAFEIPIINVSNSSPSIVCQCKTDKGLHE